MKKICYIKTNNTDEMRSKIIKNKIAPIKFSHYQGGNG